MALIMGVVVVGLEQLPPQISGTFTTVARNLDQQDALGRGKSVGAATQIAAASVDPPANGISTRLLTQLAGITLCAGVWIALVIHRRGAEKRKARERDALEHAVEEIHEEDERLFTKRQQILAALCGDVSALASGEVNVSHVMSTALLTVGVRTSVKDVIALMSENKLRHLLVCDDERLVGVISDRDLARKTGRVAMEMMTGSPLTVTPDTRLNPAVTLMVRKRISCLPVVENGRLVGLFTTTDLIMTLQCAFQLLRKAAPNLAEELAGEPKLNLRDTRTPAEIACQQAFRPKPANDNPANLHIVNAG
jgi:acetoin utilization protein AcuB